MKIRKTIPAAEDPRISCEIRSFLSSINTPDSKPLEQLGVEKARQVLVDLQQSIAYDYSEVEESTKQITYDNNTINLYIVKPTGASKEEHLPGFLFFHGGGWVLGDYQTHKRLVSELVIQSGAIAIFPEYSRSPEAKFPIAIHQAYAATKWVAEYGNEIGVDGSRIAVVGNSVGGNMATVVALLSKENNGPYLRQQILLWPVTDANFNRESYLKFGVERFLTTSLMQWMWDQYLPDTASRKHRYASPLQATLQELKELPPTLIQVAENDILHDEAVEYGRKLDEAGVPTTIAEYKGLIHDYGMLNPLQHINAVNIAINHAAQTLKKALFNN